MIKIITGDCKEKLKDIEANFIDSMVTDPPYGLKFMNKKWDYSVPKVEVWQECLRVLKPGAFALVACGTRTQHRMAVNLEDAGFEIRDIVAWIYGSGFPKSLNVGKAVDKLQGNERKDLGEYDHRRLQDGANRKDRAIGGQQVAPSETSKLRATKGNSPYEGYGTALKPAMELWTLCRKPLEEKTVAKNVLKYGTGGLNIDECRVGSETVKGQKAGQGFNNVKGFGVNTKQGDEKAKEYTSQDVKGRFPANVIHDGSEEVVNLFPDTKSGAMKKSYEYTNNGYSLGKPTGSTTQIHEASSGSASRFFYCAKASKSEKNKGLEELEDKLAPKRDDNQLYGMNTNQFRPDGSERKKLQPRKNFHPTVKPIKLMRYLCKLITPKGGIIIDPYAGSGSTGVAAELEGFDAILIEKKEDYSEISEKRVEANKINF